MRNRFYIPLCVAVFALSGCNKGSDSSDAQEERNPLVKTGQAYMEQQLWSEAEQAFKEAIDNNPRMARPHLDLALIYQQYKPNYVHAIYHYDRYLELRPESEKAEFINEQKTKLQQAVANNIIKESTQVKQVLDELGRLQKENAALKSQLASAGAVTTPAAPEAGEQATATSAASAEPKQTAPAATSHQIYHVVAGDTLTKIATKFYGDSSNWEAIFEANKDTLSSPRDLRVGQTLVIPAAE